MKNKCNILTSHKRAMALVFLYEQQLVGDIPFLLPEILAQSDIPVYHQKYLAVSTEYRRRRIRDHIRTFLYPISHQYCRSQFKIVLRGKKSCKLLK